MADHAHDAHGSHDTAPKREIFWLILVTLIVATAGLGAAIGPEDDDEDEDTTEHVAEVEDDHQVEDDHELEGELD